MCNTLRHLQCEQCPPWALPTGHMEDIMFHKNKERLSYVHLFSGLQTLQVRPKRGLQLLVKVCSIGRVLLGRVFTFVKQTL